MNKEELIKEYDEKAKALRDEFISKLEDDKKEFEVELPEDRKAFYYIDSADGEISTTVYYTNDIDCKFLFEHGYFFESEEEAKQHLKERKLLFKLHQWAKINNDGWEPDWKNTQQLKHYIEIDMHTKKFTAWYTSYNSRFTKLPYFKSKEITKACTDEFGEEIKEVLC